jgi:putative membrane protein
MWHSGFFPFAPIVAILVISLIIRLVMFRRHGWHGGCGGPGARFEAESLLRTRLVKGEINEEEYLRLKAILKK